MTNRSTSRDGASGRPRRGATTPDGTMHRSISPLGVGGFSGEPDRVLDRPRELRRSFRSSDERVAVGAARVWIRVPVVSQRVLELRLDPLLCHTKVFCQRGDGSAYPLVIAESVEPSRLRPTGPANYRRQMRRMQRPANRKILSIAVEKARPVEKAITRCCAQFPGPPALTEKHDDARHRSHRQSTPHFLEDGN